MVTKKASQRFKEIIKILGNYGFGYILNSKIKKNGSYAENLRKAFEELGPTFIKIGQLLSTRPDILPESYIKELQKLQNNAPPIDYSEVKQIIETEFNSPINSIFIKFDKIPTASASIAQAHRAVTNDGTPVIVKIQRPGIKENMELDIEILKKIFALTKAKFQDALVDPIEALDEIIESARKEFNFINEANSIEKFCNLNSKIKFVDCPKVIKKYCSMKVLTMEYIDGIKITDVNRLKKEGYDTNDIGKKLALSYIKQIFEDGFFHGDPHPGNLLIREGKIYYIDFGIMGNISNSLKSALNCAIKAIAYKDIDMMITAIFTIGIRKGYVDKNKLYEDIDYMFTSYLSVSLQNIQISQLIQEVFEVAKRNNIKLPADLTLLIKGLVIIEGVVAKISPDVNIIDIAAPYVKSMNKSDIMPSFDDFLLNTYIFARDTTSLPSKLVKALNNINEGRMKIQMEHKNLDEPVHELNKMINRLIFAMIVCALIMGSSLILRSNAGPKIYDVSIVGLSGYVFAAFISLYLLISIIKSGKL